MSKVYVLLRFSGHGSTLSSLILCISGTHSSNVMSFIIKDIVAFNFLLLDGKQHRVLEIDVLPSKMPCIFYVDSHIFVLTFTFFVYFQLVFFFFSGCMNVSGRGKYILFNGKKRCENLTVRCMKFHWTITLETSFCSIPMWRVFSFGEIRF